MSWIIPHKMFVFFSLFLLFAPMVVKTEEEIINICFNDTCPKLNNKTYYCLACRNTNLKGCFERKEDFCCGCMGLVCYACDTERNCPTSMVVVLAIICIIAIFLLWRRLKYGKFGEPSFSHARPCDDQSYGYQQVDDQHSPDLNTYTPSSPVQFGSNTSFNYPIEERFLFNRGSLQSSFKDSAPIVSPKNSDWRVENDSYGSLGTSINS